MLPNGKYYVGLRDRFTGNGSDTLATRQIRGCSGPSGSFTVLDYPNLTFTSPNPAGSADDFATVVLNNPWDFDSVADIDVNHDITSSGIAGIAAERPDGTDLGTVRVFKGISAPATVNVPGIGPVGDPYSYLIRSDLRGLNNRIDTSRYRLFSTDTGLNRPRDLAHGSHLRVIWHIAGETWDTTGVPSVVADAENESSDLVLRHMQVGSVAQDSIVDQVRARSRAVRHGGSRISCQSRRM